MFLCVLCVYWGYNFNICVISDIISPKLSLLNHLLRCIVIYMGIEIRVKLRSKVIFIIICAKKCQEYC